MTRIVVALEALAKGLGAAAELVRKLERTGVILPLGKDADGQVWVEVEARQKLERVRALMAAGYAEKDIALVIGRVEKAGGQRPKLDLVCDATALAAEAGVEPAEIGAWVAADLFPVWARREDGAPLFLVATIELARLFAAADALDLGAHKALLGAVVRRDGRADARAVAALGQAIGERLGRLERAAKVMRKLLPLLEPERPAAPRRRLLARRKKGTTTRLGRQR